MSWNPDYLHAKPIQELYREFYGLAISLTPDRRIYVRSLDGSPFRKNPAFSWLVENRDHVVCRLYHEAGIDENRD